MRIIVISVYFGKLPEYFPLWLKSCEFNRNIDFLVLSDQDTTDISLPNNVTISEYSLERMQKDATQVLGFEANLFSPYKCCDYKPLYGAIFQSRIAGYDYWGYCDLDLIFGDVEGFIKKYDLLKYDRFLPLGHFSLYKNTNSVNNSFKLQGSYVDYQTVYTSSENFAFDETDGTISIFKKNCLPLFDNRIFADIDKKHKRFRLSTYCVPQGERVNWKYQVFYWDNGHVFRDRIVKRKVITDEFCYIHFQKRKKMVNADVEDNINSFYITDCGFFAKKNTVDMDEIRKYNPPSFPGKELFEDLQFGFKHFLLKCKRVISRYTV